MMIFQLVTRDVVALLLVNIDQKWSQIDKQLLSDGTRVGVYVQQYTGTSYHLFDIKYGFYVKNDARTTLLL